MKTKDLFSDSKLREFGKDYVKLLTKFIKDAGKDSSGRLVKSVKYKLKKETEEIKIIIESEKYLTYVDKGRKPGTYPNIKAISNFAKIKGLPQTAVFPIAHSIFKFGIKPTNIIQKTIKALESPQYTRKIEKEGAKNIETLIYHLCNANENTNELILK